MRVCLVPRLHQIIPIVLARAANADNFYEYPILERGLIVAARIMPNGLRKLYALRSLEDKYFPSKPEQMQNEIDKVKKAASFPTHAAVPVTINNRRGLSVLEISQAEIEAKIQKALDFTANRLQERQNERLEYALQLMLQLNPQHPDCVQSRLELWRDGLSQFPQKLESKINEFQTDLAKQQG